MADCKACGAWFESTETQDLCPTCKRSLLRLGDYVAPVVRCKDCANFRQNAHGVCWCEEYGGAITPEDYCSRAKMDGKDSDNNVHSD